MTGLAEKLIDTYGAYLLGTVCFAVVVVAFAHLIDKARRFGLDIIQPITTGFMRQQDRAVDISRANEASSKANEIASVNLNAALQTAERSMVRAERISIRLERAAASAGIAAKDEQQDLNTSTDGGGR